MTTTTTTEMVLGQVYSIRSGYGYPGYSEPVLATLDPTDPTHYLVVLYPNESEKASFPLSEGNIGGQLFLDYGQTHGGYYLHRESANVEVVSGPIVAGREAQPEAQPEPAALASLLTPDELVTTISELQAQITRLDARVTDVANQRDQALANANQAWRELEDFRTEIRDALIEEGENRGWCNELDKFLAKHGMEGRTRDFHVTVNFSGSVTVTVQASSEEEATENLDEEEVYDAIRQHGVGYTVDSFEADYAEEA